MANNHRRGGCGRRHCNNHYGCLNSVEGRWRRDNFPYYDGPCPDVDGAYECDCDDEQGDERDDERCDNRGDRRRCGRRRRRGCEPFGVLTAMLPIAVAANGIVPLVNNNCFCGGGGFDVNSGLITVEEAGTYLATYSVRVPEGSTLDSTFTLNVNDASQSSAILEVGGDSPACFTGQAIFDVNDRATVAVRSSEAINLTETSAQPLVTLSLVQI